MPAPFTPRIHAVTLAVADLERALAFYRDGLGLPSKGITGTEFAGDDERPDGSIVFFELEGGLMLSLYPRSELAKDAGVDPSETAGSGMSIGHFVDRRERVDELLQRAAAAGARVHGPAHERPWGPYSGYFSDLDGHLWEVVHFTPSPARPS